VLLEVVSATKVSVEQVSEYAAWRIWMNIWMNMDDYAGKDAIGRAKMSSRQEQGKARTVNISGKQNHGKKIKTRAPGAARAGANGTG